MPNELEIVRPNLTEYQNRMLYGAERITITEAATKCGKTFSHLWWLFEQALQSNKDGANYWWVAPVHQQAMIAFNRLRRAIKGVKGFKVILNGTIYCPNGAVIIFKSADKPDTLYGEDVWACVMDEFTRCKEEAFFAVRSTLTKTNGKLKLIGNAKGKKNWGYKLGLKARSGEPNYAYHRITAYDAAAAGIITVEEIEQAKRDLPELVFNELYLAEPNEDGSNPFGNKHILACLQKALAPGKPVAYGIDLAKSVDWTVIVGLNSAGRICYFDRYQKDWKLTRSDIIRTIGSTPAMIDSTGVGDPIVEDIQVECKGAEGFHYSGKQKLMEGLVHGVQNGYVAVLEGIMREEMEAFEFAYSARGVTYEAPSGVHDDCVNGLALAHRMRMTMPKPLRQPRISD